MKDNVISETDVMSNKIKIAARNVQVYYGDNHAIKDVSARRGVGSRLSCVVSIG